MRRQAKEKVIRFGQIYGREALDLACHAAFPLAITPDLLYCIRENFLPEISWLTVPDLLMSPLCAVVGNELYEMDGEIRDVLLRRLAGDFGESRLHTLADFMGAYIQTQMGDVGQDLGQNLEWIALAYANPNNIEQLRKEIKKRIQEENGQVRQQIASFLEEQEDLLLAAGLEPLIAETDRWLQEADEFPGISPLEDFSFETAAIVFPNEAELPPIEMQTVEVATIAFEEVSSQTPPSYVEQLSIEQWLPPSFLGKRSFFANTHEIDLEMILVPVGSFLMGSPEDDNRARANEKPQHLVKVPAFYIAKYPTTQAQWQAVANLPEVEIKLTEEPSNFQGDDYPVERISWYEAEEFCARLSQYTGKKYRLPSEAEWEYACRAVTIEDLSVTQYCFGDNQSHLKDYAWYQKNSNNQPHAVGQKKPNDLGLYDMHGNVWEWCLDDYHESYKGAPADGSAWIDQNHKNASKVRRGGSWINNYKNCRSAFRNFASPIEKFNNVGFRIVCDV